MTGFNRKDQAPQWLRLSKLTIRWPEAQRPFDEKRARKIAAAFDPDSFTPVVVSQPDAAGMHHIIDGQHRVGAARIALGTEQCVACYVVQCDTPEEAARIFNVINNERTAVSAIDRFRTAVTEGQKLPVEVANLLRQLGYRIGSTKADGTLSAVDACLSVARIYKSAGLRDALLMLQGAWGKAYASHGGIMIKGMAAFLAAHGDAIDRDRLAHKLAKDYTAARFLGQVRARADTLNCKLGEAIIGALIDIYNDGLRSGRIGRKEQLRAAA